jgi:hypothetical protein
VAEAESVAELSAGSSRARAKKAAGGSRARAKKAAGGSRVGQVIPVPGTGPEAGPKVADMVVEVAGMVPGIGPEAGPKVAGMVVEVAGMVLVVEVMILEIRIIFNVPINNGHVRNGAGGNEKLPRLSENSYVSPTVYKYT